MEIIRHEIDGVVEIRPKFHRDQRGWFAETFNRGDFEAAGLPCDFVQDNRSLSRATGTLRGLHFQIGPHAQAKLVSATKGSIFDVAVDLRRGSPTFGRHVAVTLSAELGNQLLIPEGFGHGYCTLEPDTEVFYKVSRLYAPVAERAVLWSDPALGVVWPAPPDEIVISERDASAPSVADSPDLFE